MSSSPYQSPASDPVAPDAEVETISASKGRMRRSMALGLLAQAIAMVGIIRGQSSWGEVAHIWSEILSKYRHGYVYGYFSLLVLMALALPILMVPRSFRRMESRMRQLLVAPGDTAVRQIGLASQWLPLLGGALVLTGSELVFYRRAWLQYSEKRRIPLAEIATVQAGKGILLPRLVLTLSSGRILKFRVLDGERWREAIQNAMDQAQVLR